MDLLERYLAAVQQELPKEKQQDVTRELQANILDQLDALREQTPEQTDEQHLHNVLLELGPPKKMAHQFHPPQPLIHTEQIPLYSYTLFMVFGVIFVIQVIQSSMLWLGSDQVGLLLMLKHLAGGFIRDATFAFSAITLGFWLIGKDQNAHCKQVKSWDPSKLPQLSRQKWQRIELSDIFTDLATYLFLLILIWYPAWGEVQSSFSLTEQSRFILQVFSPVLLLGIANNLWQLSQRNWTPALLKANLLLNAFMVIAILLLALTGPLLTDVPERLHWLDADRLHRSITISLLILALFPGWEVIRDWRRLLQLK